MKCTLPLFFTDLTDNFNAKWSFSFASSAIDTIYIWSIIQFYLHHQHSIFLCSMFGQIQTHTTHFRSHFNSTFSFGFFFFRQNNFILEIAFSFRIKIKAFLATKIRRIKDEERDPKWILTAHLRSRNTFSHLSASFSLLTRFDSVFFSVNRCVCVCVACVNTHICGRMEKRIFNDQRERGKEQEQES